MPPLSSVALVSLFACSAGVRLYEYLRPLRSVASLTAEAEAAVQKGLVDVRRVEVSLEGVVTTTAITRGQRAAMVTMPEAMAGWFSKQVPPELEGIVRPQRRCIDRALAAGYSIWVWKRGNVDYEPPFDKLPKDEGVLHNVLDMLLGVPDVPHMTHRD